MPTSTECARISRSECAALTLVWGAVVGACLALCDATFHGVLLEPVDALISLAFVTVPTVLVFAIVSAMCHFATRAAHLPLGRNGSIRLLAIMVWLSLNGGFALFVTDGHRDWTGLVLLAATLPPALPVSWLAVRLSARRGNGTLIGVALLNGLILVACGRPLLRAWGFHPAAQFICVFVVIVLLAATQYLWRRYGRIVAVALVLLVFGRAFFPMARSVASPVKESNERRDATNSPPNVVLIVLDTTRRDFLGCYGHRPTLTPNLDVFAGESAVYENMISSSAWTVPSHASLFTGLFPRTHGCTYEHHAWLDGNFDTLAKLLQQGGYQTSAFVSNPHLMDCNVLQGFERVTTLFGRYDRLSMHPMANALGLPADWVDKGGAAACDEIDHWLGSERDPRRPFLLFLNLFEVHLPYLPPLGERWAHRPRNAGFLETTEFGLKSGSHIVELMIQGKVDPHAAEITRALYSAAVEYQDRILGRILESLQSRVDLDNTMVVILSDHGENLGEEGRWEHLFAINDLLIHVPLIIRYPRTFKPGTRVKGLCQNTDVLPTIFDVIGRTPPAVAGRTLVPSRFVPRDAAFTQVYPHFGLMSGFEFVLGPDVGPFRFNVHRRSIRTERYKYVWQSDGHHQLYDMRHDALESRNLVATQPQMASSLQQQLFSWWDSMPAYVRKVSPDSPRQRNRDLHDRLKSLGYLSD